MSDDLEPKDQNTPDNDPPAGDDPAKDDDLLKGDGKDIHRLKSWVGRLEADRKKDREILQSIASKLDGLNRPAAEPDKPTFQGNDERAKFNEKLHEMILDGKVVEAMEIVNEVNRKAQDLQRRHAEKQFDAAISSIAEDPVVKNEDTGKKVREMARGYMEKGLGANEAVRLAKAEVESAVLRHMIESGNARPGALEMLGGPGTGKPAAAQEDKLPPQFEEAYQKAKKKGLFKDRKEYIGALSPMVRQEFGL